MSLSSHRRRTSVAHLAASKAVTTAALLVGAIALVAPPAGADVIRVDPIVAPQLAPGTQWQLGSINDGGYAVSYPSFPPPVAWGRDVGAVVPTDLAVTPEQAQRMELVVVNESGLAGGSLYNSQYFGPEPFVADLHTKQVDFLDLGGEELAQITGIGANGTVVGVQVDLDTVPLSLRAVAWVGPDHTLVRLQGAGGDSAVTDVNADGLAAGWFLDGAGRRHPATWDPAQGTAVRDLAPITGIQSAGASAVEVNDRGDVLVHLGLSTPAGTSPDGNDVVVLAGTSTAIPLYPLGTGWDTVLNNRGQVAFATGSVPGVRTSLVVLDVASGERTEIPQARQLAFFFNDRGQIATTDAGTYGGGSAIVWDPVRGWIDLGDGGGRGLTVTGSNSVGNVIGRYDDTVTPWIATVQLAPEPPVDLRATSVEGAVDVGWNVPASDGDASIQSYRVFRDGAPIAEVPGSTTSYHDASPGPVGSIVRYSVTAVNQYGESRPSAAVEVLVAAAAAAPTSTPAAPVAVTPAFAG